MEMGLAVDAVVRCEQPKTAGHIASAQPTRPRPHCPEAFRFCIQLQRTRPTDCVAGRTVCKAYIEVRTARRTTTDVTVLAIMLATDALQSIFSTRPELLGRCPSHGFNVQLCDAQALRLAESRRGLAQAKRRGSQEAVTKAQRVVKLELARSGKCATSASSSSSSFSSSSSGGMGAPGGAGRNDEMRRIALTVGSASSSDLLHRKRSQLRRKNDRAIARGLESLLGHDRLLGRLRTHQAEVSRIRRDASSNIAQQRDAPEEPCTATPGAGSAWRAPPKNQQRGLVPPGMDAGADGGRRGRGGGARTRGGGRPRKGGQNASAGAFVGAGAGAGVGVGGTEASWLDINEVDDKRCEELASRLFVMETIVAAEGNTDHLVLAVAEPSGALGASGTLGAGGWGGVSGGEAKSGGGYDGSTGRGHGWGGAEEGGGGGRERRQRGGEGRGGRPKLPSREARNLYIAPNTVPVKPGAVDAETGDYLHDALFSMLTTSDFARRRSTLAKKGLAMTRSDAALEALEDMRQEEDNMLGSSREIGEIRESEGRGI